jgi:hypothetical protein
MLQKENQVLQDQQKTFLKEHEKIISINNK